MTIARGKATEEFIEAMGLALQAQNLPRTGGRIVAYLLLQPGPVGFDELVEKLQVSRSGVSTNTRDLERFGVINRTTRPGDRQYYFSVSDKALAHLLEQHVAHLANAREAIATALQSIGPDVGQGHDRLKKLHRFYGTAITKTSELIEEISDSPGSAAAVRRPRRKSAASNAGG